MAYGLKGHAGHWHCRLDENDGACVAQGLNKHSILGRYVVCPGAVAECRPQTGFVDVIFDADGQAVQRTDSFASLLEVSILFPSQCQSFIVADLG